MKLVKTIKQYNKMPVSRDDMEKLLEIASDYNHIKNETYARYGGVRSISKLYPGFTIQKELKDSGLKERLQLPSVYYNVAVLEAAGDLRGSWGIIKHKIAEAIKSNANFSEDDRHYLRFALKIDNIFNSILAGTHAGLESRFYTKYYELAEKVNKEKLDNYLRRQARKHHQILNTERTTGFSMTERAYRYADHGIYISTKEPRKRIFIPLTDNHTYKRQLRVRLFPEREAIEIQIPVNRRIRKDPGFVNNIAVSLGFFTMLSTNTGNMYGERLGDLNASYAKWMREQMVSYMKNRRDNPGRKKYNAKRHRMEEELHSYINAELNRFLKEEQPKTVYLAKLPRKVPSGNIKAINLNLNMWKRGYIRERLELKCAENGVELIEVFGKGIGTTCSSCGAEGIKKGGVFTCDSCGNMISDRINAAKNTFNRGTLIAKGAGVG